MAKSIRLYFHYDSADPQSVTLVKASRLRSIALAPSSPAPMKGQAGFWYEVVGPANEVLHARSCSSLIAFDSETFNEHNLPIRVPTKKPRGTFTLLIPDVPGATGVRLWGSPPNPREGGKVAAPWGNFPIPV